MPLGGQLPIQRPLPPFRDFVVRVHEARDSLVPVDDAAVGQYAHWTAQLCISSPRGQKRTERDVLVLAGLPRNALASERMTASRTVGNLSSQYLSTLVDAVPGTEAAG